jgi:hypothetical protein
VKAPARTKSIVAGFAVGALALAAPAAGSVAQSPTSSAGGSAAQVAESQNGGQAPDAVLRSDGEHAVPFVAELSPPAPSASVAGDGDAFDWGAAAIGAGVALFATALLMAGAGALGSRRREGKPAAAVSQGT